MQNEENINSYSPFEYEPALTASTITLIKQTQLKQPKPIQVLKQKQSQNTQLDNSFNSPFLTQGYFLKAPKEEDPLFAIANFTPVVNEKQKPTVIDKGSLSTIYLYRNVFSKKLYALKYMQKSIITERLGSLDPVYKEITIHSKITHDNIIKLFSYEETKNSLKMLLEYAPNHNLYQVIKKVKKLKEEEAFNYFIQAANAIYFLHENNIIHRDIKPENLLLDEVRKIKLCDFGWSSEVEIKNRKTFCGTCEYLAPEIIKEEPYDKSIDIWALGVLLFEMIYGRTPFKKVDTSEEDEIVINIIGNKIEFPDEDLLSETTNDDCSPSQECKDLIKQMLEQDKDKRITIKDVFISSFAKKYEYKIYKTISSNDNNSNNKQENNIHVIKDDVNNEEQKAMKDKENEMLFGKVLDQVNRPGKKVIRKEKSVTPKKKKENINYEQYNYNSYQNDYNRELAINKSIDVSQFSTVLKKQNTDTNIVMYDKPKASKEEVDNKNEDNGFRLLDESAVKKVKKAETFLNSINRRGDEENRKPRKHRKQKKDEKTQMKHKPKSDEIKSDVLLTESIKMIEKKGKDNNIPQLKPGYDLSTDNGEKKEEEPKESFWDRLFKNFKCGN